VYVSNFETYTDTDGTFTVVLQDEDMRLATISLSTAAVTVLVHASSLEVKGRLGSLSLVDDAAMISSESQFREVLSIEGDNFADFEYKTFDPATVKGKSDVNSSFVLNAASIRLNFVEHALRSIYVFMIKLATLKSLYDAATQAAVQRASEIQRMHFQISIKSPIVVFPTNDLHSGGHLTMRLGEFSAKNAYDGDENRMNASLHGLHLVSAFEKQSSMKMIDNIDIDAEVVSTANVDRQRDTERPDTQVRFDLSLISVSTFIQLCSLGQRQGLRRPFALGANTICGANWSLSNYPSCLCKCVNLVCTRSSELAGRAYSASSAGNPEVDLKHCCRYAA
jgi:vacuolar protein sorting-associated protein 13A/C